MEKFIPVVVIKEIGETDKILTALKGVGINCAEITFRTACAAEAIAYASKNYPDMEIGAGTVINAEQCEAALAAGATFIVSPGLSPAVAKICNERGIPYFPHVSLGWDNNPRFTGFREGVIKNATPEKIEEALRVAKDYVDSHDLPAPLITVNSWNEWTETSYLEPDTLYGYGYLEAIKKVFVDGE